MSKKVLGVSEDLETAIKLCREYEKTTGFYARVAEQIQEGKRTYVVYGYDEVCRLSKYIPGMTHNGLRVLAGTYLASSRLGTQLQAMAKNPTAPPIVHEMVKEVLLEKKATLEKIGNLISNHPIYRWCSIVTAGRGGSLGAAAAIVFLGYIDPHEATTAGKAKKYWGFTPEGKLRSGSKASFNTRLKGIGFFTATRVVMGRDSYYRPLFDAKKEYYVSKGVNFPHNKAIYWLAALLISHAQQIIRESEGYSVPRHRMHIEPKQHEDQTPDERILEALRKGEVLQE